MTEEAVSRQPSLCKQPRVETEAALGGGGRSLFGYTAVGYKLYLFVSLYKVLDVRHPGAGGDEGVLVAVELSPVLVPIPAEPEGCERRNCCVLLFNPFGSPYLSEPPSASAYSLEFIV